MIVALIHKSPAGYKSHLPDGIKGGVKMNATDPRPTPVLILMAGYDYSQVEV